MTVTGTGFIPGPVQITWNGAPLATAPGPGFSTTVSIPSAAPGVYYLEATAQRPDGTVAGRASRAFRVTAASAVPPQRPSREPADRARRKRTATRAEQPRPQTVPGPERAAASSVGKSTVTTGARPRSVPAAREATARSAADDAQVRTPSGDDLWSGFEGDGGDAALARADAAAEDTDPRLLASLAALGAGLVALAGGTALALSRRPGRRRARGGRSSG